MDIWTGSLALPDGSSVKDITLAYAMAASSPSSTIAASVADLLTATASLTFLALVDTALIPLRLAVASPLQAHTGSATSTAFFARALRHPLYGPVPDFSSENTTPAPAMPDECSLGVLARIDAVDSGASVGTAATEVLFFLSSPARHQTGTASPPRSPHAHKSDVTTQPSDPQLLALLLSSHLLHAGTSPPSPPSEATFLPPLIPPSHAHTRTRTRKPAADRDPDPSRKRTAHLFDAAVAARRKRPRVPEPVPGGIEAVGVAGGKHVRSGSIDAGRAAARGAHSRSPSLGAGGWCDAVNGGSRPGSRAGKRVASSGLREVASAGSAAEAGAGGGRESAGAEGDDAGAEARNRETLSRVVMAAMRMHGMARRGRRDAGADGEPEAGAEAQAEKDAEEYKQVYHHVFRAAAFALRRHMAKTVLGGKEVEGVREVVEGLVAVMVGDPLGGIVEREEGRAWVGGEKGGKEKCEGDRGSPFAAAKKEAGGGGEIGIEAGVLSVRRKTER